MSNTLTVRLSNRKTPEGEYYEATIEICNLRPTKLVRPTDKTTRFPTRSSVLGAVRNFAKAQYYTSVNIIEPKAATTSEATKKAAKKSTSAKTSTTQTSTSKKTATKPTSNTTNTSTSTTAQRTR